MGRGGEGARRRHRLFAVALVLLLMPLAPVVTTAPALAAEREITSDGPLTRIITGDLLNCQVAYRGDAAFEFFPPSSVLGACGTFLAVDGVLYGPADVPAALGLTLTPYTPVSQSGVTGSGTAASPFRIVTVVDVGGTGLRLTQTDSYVVGEESYRTDLDVSSSGPARSVVLYRAGDCYLQGSDFGYGWVDTGRGAVACTVNPNNVPAGRIEQFLPISSGSSYIEGSFIAVWAAVGSRNPFPSTCQCTTDTDNAAGLSWSFDVPAGGSETRSHLLTFSPEGAFPLAASKTADSATADPGGGNGYTITVTNSNPDGATLEAVTDTLPAGFTYRQGSTTGATSEDPSVSGQELTWDGPFTVPASGSISLHFEVTVADAEGRYLNNAGGRAEGGTAVAPTGDTAPIQVGEGDGGGAGRDIGVGKKLKYLAIGDSFASGAGNRPYESPRGEGEVCQRSRHRPERLYDRVARLFRHRPRVQGSYPNALPSELASLVPRSVARRLGFVHESHACAGARARDITNRQHPKVEPQLDELERNADLVTLTVGGNDAGYAGAMTLCLIRDDCFESPSAEDVQRCERLLQERRLSIAPYRCGDDLGERGEDEIDALDPSGSERGPLDRVYRALDRKLRGLGQRSQLRVVVGYPELFPTAEEVGAGDVAECEAVRVGGAGAAGAMTRAEMDGLLDLGRRLNSTIEEAAEANGLVFVAVDDALDGHELCTDDPWVRGVGEAPAFHPTSAGQQSMGREVAAQIFPLLDFAITRGGGNHGEG